MVATRGGDYCMLDFRVFRLALAALLLMPCAASAQATAQRPTLFLGTGVGEPYTTPDRRGFLDEIVAEMFGRLGYDARVTVYESSARALLQADAGYDDGQALRAKGLEQKYPNLVAVPTVLMMNDFVACTAKAQPAAVDWTALKPYALTYIIGWKVFEDSLTPAHAVTGAKDGPQMFTLLANDRADICLYERWQALALARRMGLPVRVLEPPLAQTPMYIFLHKKHAALIPKAAAALQAMRDDGTYQAIFERTLGRYATDGQAH
jgi:polar amino acid transport system substrate-binding protein